LAVFRFEIETTAFYGHLFKVLKRQSFVHGEVLLGFHLVEGGAFLFVLIGHCRLEFFFFKHFTPSHLLSFDFSFLQVSAEGALGLKSLRY